MDGLNGLGSIFDVSLLPSRYRPDGALAVDTSREATRGLADRLPT